MLILGGNIDNEARQCVANRTRDKARKYGNGLARLKAFLGHMRDDNNERPSIRWYFEELQITRQGNTQQTRQKARWGTWMVGPDWRLTTNKRRQPRQLRAGNKLICGRWQGKTICGRAGMTRQEDIWRRTITVCNPTNDGREQSNGRQQQ